MKQVVFLTLACVIFYSSNIFAASSPSNRARTPDSHAPEVRAFTRGKRYVAQPPLNYGQRDRARDLEENISLPESFYTVFCCPCNVLEIIWDGFCHQEDHGTHEKID